MNGRRKRDPSLQWMVRSDERYSICGQTIETLPAGAFTCFIGYDGEAVFKRRQLLVDELIDIPNSLSSQILEEIDHFWGLGHRFREMGFLHRRGYLLFGKQGSGKSSLIHQVIDKIVDQGNVAFFCEDPRDFIRSVEQFRRVEPRRPMVCVFEDIDAIIEYFGDSALLQWLDGNNQVDRAVNLASTNYPEELDPRIVARPRRFDRVLRIDSPSERLRDAYFSKKLPKQSPEERYEWVSKTEGLPFACLAELVISVYCLGNDLDETIRLLKDQDAQSLFGLDEDASKNGEAKSKRRARAEDDYDDVPF